MHLLGYAVNSYSNCHFITKIVVAERVFPVVRKTPNLQLQSVNTCGTKSNKNMLVKIVTFSLKKGKDFFFT